MRTPEKEFAEKTGISRPALGLLRNTGMPNEKTEKGIFHSPDECLVWAIKNVKGPIAEAITEAFFKGKR